MADLRHLGVLSETDRNAMTRYCVAWARYEAAYKVIQAEGETFTAITESGNTIRPRPEVNIMKSCANELHRLDQEFGLTASARTRLAPGKREETDEMLSLLQGRFGTTG